MSQQQELIPPEPVTKPRVWTLDELEPIVRAVWPEASFALRSRMHDVMMVLEGYFPPRVSEPERERILAAYKTGGGPNA